MGSQSSMLGCCCCLLPLVLRPQRGRVALQGWPSQQHSAQAHITTSRLRSTIGLGQQCNAHTLSETRGNKNLFDSYCLESRGWLPQRMTNVSTPFEDGTSKSPCWGSGGGSLMHTAFTVTVWGCEVINGETMSCGRREPSPLCSWDCQDRWQTDAAAGSSSEKCGVRRAGSSAHDRGRRGTASTRY